MQSSNRQKEWKRSKTASIEPSHDCTYSTGKKEFRLTFKKPLQTKC